MPGSGIEIRTRRLQGDGNLAVIESLVVAQPDDLILSTGDESGVESGMQPRDRDWWESERSQAFMMTVDAIAKCCNESVGPSRIDYSAQSYISLKKGRRCWLPMWPRKDGAYVYLPRGEDGAEDAPSDFYSRVKTRLEEIGLEAPSWTYKYNGGANPIGFMIPQDKVAHSLIREILAEAYELA